MAEEICMQGMKLLLPIPTKCATLERLKNYLSGLRDLENQLKVIDTVHRPIHSISGPKGDQQVQT